MFKVHKLLKVEASGIDEISQPLLPDRMGFKGGCAIQEKGGRVRNFKDSVFICIH